MSFGILGSECRIKWKIELNSVLQSVQVALSFLMLWLKNILHKLCRNLCIKCFSFFGHTKPRNIISSLVKLCTEFYFSLN